MKRSGLVRRTPLRARVGLTNRSELRRTPLAPVSAKRLRDNQERAKVVSGMRLASDGICPRCGRSDLPLRGHERIARAHGGDFIHPDVLIDDLCNTEIEDTPQVSCWNGWKQSPKWPHDPALSPTQARALDGSIVEFVAPVGFLDEFTGEDVA